MTRPSVAVAFLVATATACAPKAPPPTPPPAPPPAETTTNSAGDAPAAAAPLPQGPPTSTPRPGSVLAVAVIPNPLATLEAGAAFAVAAQLPLPLPPDAIVATAREGLAGLGLGAVKLDAPAYGLFVDANPAEAGWAVVIPTEDPAALAQAVTQLDGDVITRAHDGYAFVGPPQALRAASDYALTQLRREPLPAHPTVTGDLANVRSAYAAQLAMGRAMIAGQAASASPDEARALEAVLSMMGILDQLESASVVLEVTPQLATIGFGLTGAPATLVSAFFAAQTPGAFSERSRLGTGPLLMEAAGKVDLAPIADVLGKLNEAIVGGDAGAVDWTALFLISDEFAMGADYEKAARFRWSMRLDDPTKYETSVSAWIDAMKNDPSGLYEPGSVKVSRRRSAGVPVTEVEFRYAAQNPAANVPILEEIFGPPPMRMLYAKLPERVLSTSFYDARANLRSFVRAARANRPRPTSPAFEQARARGESVAASVDVGGILSAAKRPLPRGEKAVVTLGLGFGERTAQYRFSADAPSVGALVRAAQEASQ